MLGVASVIGIGFRESDLVELPAVSRSHPRYARPSRRGGADRARRRTATGGSAHPLIHDAAYAGLLASAPAGPPRPARRPARGPQPTGGAGQVATHRAAAGDVGAGHPAAARGRGRRRWRSGAATEAAGVLAAAAAGLRDATPSGAARPGAADAAWPRCDVCAAPGRTTRATAAGPSGRDERAAQRDRRPVAVETASRRQAAIGAAGVGIQRVPGRAAHRASSSARGSGP